MTLDSLLQEVKDEEKVRADKLAEQERRWSRYVILMRIDANALTWPSDILTHDEIDELRELDRQLRDDYSIHFASFKRKAFAKNNG